MNRRTALASLASGMAFLAGCETRSPPPNRPTSARTPTAEPTPTPTRLTDTKPLPSPDALSSSSDARSFVETHEERYVYNELVGGFGSASAPTEITVEPATAAVVHTSDRGYYLLSSCRGSAQYADSDGATSATRNTSSVAHFVSDELHRRIPFNAYRCERPVVPTSTADGTDGRRVARFQLYDFATDPDYDRPDEGGRTVDVTVRDAEGATILERAYQTSLPLTVQPQVTDQPGSYTLSASLADGTRVRYGWELSGPDSPEWWALALLVTSSGRLAAKRLYPNERVGLPATGVCRY